MKRTDRMVLLALPAVALVVAFWLLVLSPKREEAASLEDEVTRLEAEVADYQQAADFAEQAREQYPEDYQSVVTLGKAVPQDDDTASLFAQLSGVSAKAGVDFRLLELASTASSEAGAAPPPATPPATESTPPPAEGEAAPASDEPSTTTPATTAPATEASAASLPIGATVGPAGLPVMPYKLQFQGDFFRTADFVHGLDSTVSTADGQVNVDGRLITIDGFSMTRDSENGFPSLISTFMVTTYVTPEAEGLTSGATPSGPAPVSDAAPPTETVEQTSSTGTP